MNDLIRKEKINIENLIYEIRGKQVMLDSDLASIYKVETKRINETVKNNPLKFPDDIYFQLTEFEYSNLKFQIETSSYGGVRKLPYVFTEEGVAMLATVLHTKIASEISLKIIRAFAAMRKYISNNLIEQQYYKNMLLDDHNRINLLEEPFNKLSERQKINTLFYNGQIYDVYSLLMEILDSAKEEIIIIDDYAGKELLNILKEINKKIIIVTANINDISINKYKKQYSNIEFIESNLFHDRFIMLDRKILYNCGASFKDLGKKCFGIHLIADKEYLNIILNKIL